MYMCYETIHAFSQSASRSTGHHFRGILGPGPAIIGGPRIPTPIMGGPIGGPIGGPRIPTEKNKEKDVYYIYMQSN